MLSHAEVRTHVLMSVRREMYGNKRLHLEESILAHLSVDKVRLSVQIVNVPSIFKIKALNRKHWDAHT